MKEIILNQQQIQHKITRIAYQIYEANVKETQICVVGVAPNGFIFAEKLCATLREISELDVKLYKIEIDKSNPLASLKLDASVADFEEKSIIIADDVLNTGSTLIYAVKHFLDIPLKKIQTTVLVNRNHKKYPIKADFKGISLSTSSHNNVQVVFDTTQNSPSEDYVYLE